MTEQRLIDANALIDDIKNNLWDWKTVDGITATTVLKQTISDIGNQPTIEERKNGKWIIKEGTVFSHDVCSECGKKYVHSYPHYNFCPNCGADMRGEQS